MSIGFSEVKITILRLCDIIIENEKYFCELDSAAGDGDFGISLASGFREVKRQIDDIDSSGISQFLRGCALIISEFCGGASGPIWGAAFSGAASSVKGREALELGDIAGMFEAAVANIQKRGNAKLGDKTLLDALIPLTEALKNAAEKGASVDEAFAAAAQNATKGAEATKNMIAARGRATYLGERSLNYPDAGAMAISVIINTFVK
jgi:phosphoenolpyruvate---glycerone phosphotransferase subunit DhaL